MPGGNRLNHDEAGELFTDGEAGIADLADEVVPAGDELDDLILDEADFAKAVLHFGRGAELFDSHGHACLDAVQGAHVAGRLFARSRIGRQPVHAFSFAETARFSSPALPIADPLLLRDGND